MTNQTCVILVLTFLLWNPVVEGLGTDEPVKTNREGTRSLIAPDEEVMWQFAIMGDRTGGPAEGIRVLARAVEEINLVEPDLVLTVGDLINGYNERPLWLIQAAEFIETMGRLSRPWYPVAGNHDVYWRGKGRPDDEHESDYEQHFGPLWYWFEHKGCAFVILYSDEGDPKTGRKNFSDPACQRFTDRQLQWLDGVLENTASLEKVFVFLHHPRWISNYYKGANWDAVHDRLAAAGNVEAVFAGHIHRLHYGGKKDGIDYFTLATTGGGKAHDYPGAGWVHHWNLVTVRPSGIDVAVVPVGSLLDPRHFTPKRRALSERLLAADIATFRGGLPVEDASLFPKPLSLTLRNPVDSATLRIFLSNPGGEVEFPTREVVLGPGVTRDLVVKVSLDGAILEGSRALPVIDVACYFDDENAKSIEVPVRRIVVPLDLSGLPSRSRDGGHLSLKRPGDCVIVATEQIPLSQGAFTLEGWVQISDLEGRKPFLCKTNQSEYGIFLDDGIPSFMVHIAGAYKVAKAKSARIQPDRWHHVAGVYDGSEVRVYLDGQLVGRTAASGDRTTNALPFIVGADPNRSGSPTDSIQANIDGVRISRVARYGIESFSPLVDPPFDRHTVIQLPLDWQLAGFVSIELDADEGGQTARIHGQATCESGSAVVQ